MHGISREIQWTQLAQPANKDDTRITVMDDVDWKVGDEIVIAPTSFSSLQTEVRKIAQINSNTTFSLNESLRFRHTGIVNSLLDVNSLYISERCFFESCYADTF